METIEKTALVTGASRGIGRAIALTLAAKGYAVALNYAGSQAAAEAVKGEIEAAGGKAFTIQGDVSKAEDVDRIFKTIKEEFGQLDVLVNNAGITRDGLLIRMKEESWDAVLSTDLKSDILTIKADDDEKEERLHHQYRIRSRHHGQYRPGELRSSEGWRHRPHQGLRQGARCQKHPRQCGRTGLHRD